jgi:hypothetical protein|tara:strand:+ start:1156 stop:1764 length:609 start_codon:yes stop_codon:yes gene_type:complete
MPFNKIIAESMDLTDTYAFTGTVTGAGDTSNLVKLSSFQISNSVSSYANNSVFTSDYKKYLVTFNNLGIQTGGGHIRFKFYNDTGATSDNKMNTWADGGHSNGSAVNNYNHGGYPYLAVSMYQGTSQGINGYMWVQDPLNVNIQTHYQFKTSYTHNTGYTASWEGGGLVNDSGRYHTGFYWYTESAGNFQGECRITIFGVTH